MKPRVLIYSDCPIFGGAENLVVNILEHSDLPAEFDIRFVYRDNPPYAEGVGRKVTKPIPMRALRFPERLEWIDVMEKRVPFTPLQWLFKALFRLIEPLIFVYAILRLWRVFAAVGADIVQINNGGYPGALGCRAAAAAARLAGARRVIFNVNSAAKPLLLPKAAFELLIDWVVKRCSDVFVTASQYAGKALAARGFPAERIIQIPNSSPIPAPVRDPADVRAGLGLGPEHVAFAMLAFFGPWKGHAVLVDAVAELKREQGDRIAGLRILLVGEGPDTEPIRRRVSKAGVGEHFVFAGFRADAMEVLSASEGLVLPSIFWKGVSEDMPYCILEAMALSKPVIASALSGITETVVHEETGLLVPPSDVPALADALLRMYRDADFRVRAGKRGCERFFDLFETSQTTRRYRQLYTEIVGPRAPAKPRALIYADCPVFGGADVLTVHMLQDQRFLDEFDLSYVYRFNRRFHAGLKQRLKAAVPVTEVRFIERHELLETMERHVTFPPLRYAFKALFRAADYALLPFEVLVLWSVFRAHRPDLVHVNNGGYPGALGCRAAALAARLAGARRVVFGVNNLARPLRLPWEAAEAVIDRLVLASTDIFVTASLGARDALARRGFPKRIIEAYPNGVAEPGSVRPAAEVRAELGLADGEVAFAMIAYFEPRKGHLVLVEAARRMALAKPELVGKLRFVLVADGPELPAVKRAVGSYGLERQFSFLGYRSDALDILNACDALILPSIAAEDMPISILEAMALAKPVVASQLAGIAEEIDDGRTGLLVPPADALGLAAAVDRLASDAGLREELGRAAKERFLTLFEIGRSAERYFALYERLLGSGPRRERPASGAPACLTS
ncbi:MAG: glycosyltransferase family 4 protein [Elusimicrobia bacterium]|nr:glycosyltransferase family 4 protein [Elusimicrobiota bacterium]